MGNGGPGWRERYARVMGLPPQQVRRFEELTEAQVAEVRVQFSAGLVDVGNWVYAVRRDGSLVPRREKMRGE